MGTGNLLGAVQQPDDDYCSGRWGEISGRSNVDYAYQLIVQVVEEGADRNAHLRWPSLSEKVEDPALLLTPIGAPEGDRPRQRFRPKILIWVTAQARGLDEVVSEDAETQPCGSGVRPNSSRLTAAAMPFHPKQMYAELRTRRNLTGRPAGTD
jgi:hypothetical protein